MSEYVADRAPLFYRRLEHILNDLQTGLFLSAFRDTLDKLPSVASFQESHFGEIIAGLFGEEISGLRRLYSKLSLLTAENSNAFKMDLLFCNVRVSPVEFIFAEVKSSPKSASDGLPAGHDQSYYPSLFNSFNKYEESDRDFDLAAARDNLDLMDLDVAQRIRDALRRYGERIIKYAGFAVIDASTHSEQEAQVLATRKNSKDFNVELICIESLKETIDATYAELKKARR